MSKTIIISEDVIKSGILKEAIEFNQLPKPIRIALLRGKTPLSNNPALPSDNYLEHECTKRFSGMSDMNSVYNGVNMVSEISRLSQECSEIEKPFKNNLEKLCAEEAFALFSVPSDKIDFLIKLVDGIDQSTTEVPFGPNEELPPDLNDVNELDEIKVETEKRRVQNALNSGAALSYTRLILNKCVSRLDEFDNRLYELYNEYLDLNDYLLYYNSEETQEQNQKNLTGISLVTLGNESTKNQLKVEGINFAVLLYETIKGLLEIFTEHGAPENPVIARAVRSKSDYITAEPWYMRFGPFLWGYMETAITPQVSRSNARLIPYIFMKVSQLKPEKYLRLMRETFAGTKKSESVFRRVVEYANLKIDKSDFDARMSANRSDTSTVISDQEIVNP